MDSALKANLMQEMQSNGADLYVIPGVIYDTKTIVSGTTGPAGLNFFDGVNGSDLSLTNYASNGLPADTWFRMKAICFDVLMPASVQIAGTAAGVLDDIQKIVLSGKGFMEMKFQNIQFKAIPLSFLHGSGGAVGTAAMSAGTVAATAPELFQVGNNGVQDGGFPMLDSLLMGPQQTVISKISWPAVLTLNNGNTQVRQSLVGEWYIPI